MKSALVFFILTLSACGPESSPEKRMKNKFDSLKQQVDSLRKETNSLTDSIVKINEEILKLKRGN